MYEKAGTFKMNLKCWYVLFSSFDIQDLDFTILACID